MLQLTLFFISIYIGYKLYKFLKCPPELIDIPSLGLLAILKIATSKDSFDDMIEKDIGPMLKKHGVVRCLGPSGWGIIVADPIAVKFVLNNTDIFQKNINSTLNSNPHGLKFMGKNQITNLNEKWKMFRKLVNPVFHQTWPIEIFSKYTREALDNWSQTDGKMVRIHENIQRLNLDILGHTIFNIDFEELFGNTKYMFFSILDKLPYFRRPELYELINEYDEYIKNLVYERKKELKSCPELENKDMLSKMLQAKHEDGTPYMSISEISDNLKIFLIAGHDTTSNTLTATLYYLAKYPNVQDKLRAEILEVMSNPQVLTNPTFEDLKQMKYLNMVIKESMRIMTTAAAVERISTTPTQITNSIYLPSNTPVYLLMWQVHKQSKHFPNPKLFNPERFRDPLSLESKNWLPFLQGPRACIGSTLALTEMRVYLVLLLQKFILSIRKDNPDYEKLRLNSTSIIRPLDLRLDLTPRI